MIVQTPQDGLWYFAHPYTCKDAEGLYVLAGEEANFRLCCTRSARLIEAGWLIYSPIIQTHPIHCAWPPFVGQHAHHFWYQYDRRFIEAAGFVGIIISPGWRYSHGCCEEKCLFEKMGRPLLYFQDPCLVATEPFG